MDRLWAPWRASYIHGKKAKKCIFCQGLNSKNKSYVIMQSRYAISLLNTFPYNNGHTMVCPKRHVRDLADLKEKEILDLFGMLKQTVRLLKKVLKPDGYNIGINISRSAGAGITGHLHIHVVPRWNGDTNFMPVLYDTKVISQSLEELYKRLIHARPKTD
jgi:ATP adenylyltransferase